MRPVVAFYNIEAEIHVKARQQVNDHVPEDLSKAEDDSQDGDANPAAKDGDANPAVKDGEFELDDDINLSSPFLRYMLLDKWLAQVFEGTATPQITVYTEMRNCEPTEEEWANM